MADAEGSLDAAGLKPCATSGVAQAFRLSGLAQVFRLSGVAQAFRPAVLVAWFSIVVAASAAAQQPQPTVVSAPAAPEFLTRYDFHLSATDLLTSVPAPPPSPPDERFAWDMHFGGSFDVADLVVARLGVIAEYQAVLGSEFRPFDPNQGNYTLEGFISARINADTEVAGIFHHVSRHLSDRPKEFAVAYNEVGGRLLRRIALSAMSVDIDLEGGRAVQHSYVDYTWLGEMQVLVRHPVSERVGLFVHGSGKAFAVDETIAGRGTQAGGLIEAGVRFTGRAAAVEVFAGYEKRVDADPLDRHSLRWGLAGFRLLSR